MRILLAGTPEMVLPLFDQIRVAGSREGIEIAGVATNPPRPRGRQSAAQPTPVSIWAAEHHLPLYQRGDCDEYSEVLKAIDLVFVVAYGQLISKRFLDLPRRGWVNLHFSHLPMARGAAPVQRLIAAGITEVGYSLFRLDEGMDTGPVFIKSPTISVDGLTTGEVWKLLIEQARPVIIEQLKEIADGAQPTPQPVYQGPAGLALAPKISASEARIDWSVAAKVINQRILAFNPSPSAWTKFRGERFLIHRCTIEPSDDLSPHALAPGDITDFQRQVLVGTGDAPLRLIEVQPAGKRKMGAEDWFRGIRSFGESFE